MDKIMAEKIFMAHKMGHIIFFQGSKVEKITNSFGVDVFSTSIKKRIRLIDYSVTDFKFELP